MIVLDTNVLSELMKSEPSQAVMFWVENQSPTSLFTTTVTQAEILYGLALLPISKRREALRTAAQTMFEEDFSGRILPFDIAAAYQYAQIAAERKQAGRPISQFDAQIASITRSRGADLSTRNVSDFEGCGLQVLNPWNR
jgi:toxin FitB